jgi:putative membrane protein
MSHCPSRGTVARLTIALAVAAPLAAGACGTGGGRDIASGGMTLADTAALSATAGFVETSAAFTDAGILAMLDEANESDSSAGALAMDKATDPELKAFAAAMMQEHHALRVKGAELQKQLSLTPRLPAADPLAPTTDAEMLALRAAADGPEFDRAYVQEEVATHRVILDLAERARRATPSSGIRDYIDRMASVLHRHLARALALQKRLAPSA